MNFNQMYPGTYLKAAEVDPPIVVTVTTVALETVEQGEPQKPCMHFAETQQGIVLNRTNGEFMAEHFGPETGAWIGQRVELYSAPTTFQGKAIQGLRIRLPQQFQQPQQPAQPAPQPGWPPQSVQPAPQQPPAWPQQPGQPPMTQPGWPPVEGQQPGPLPPAVPTHGYPPQAVPQQPQQPAAAPAPGAAPPWPPQQ